MTIKEEILKYSGLLTENVNPKQVGTYILKHLKRMEDDPTQSVAERNELFHILDNVTDKKWFHIQIEDKKAKLLVFSISPMGSSVEHLKDLRMEVITDVPANKQEKVKKLFEEWVVLNANKIRTSHKGWKIYAYDRVTGDLLNLPVASA